MRQEKNEWSYRYEIYVMVLHLMIFRAPHIFIERFTPFTSVHLLKYLDINGLNLVSKENPTNPHKKERLMNLFGQFTSALKQLRYEPFRYLKGRNNCLPRVTLLSLLCMVSRILPGFTEFMGRWWLTLAIKWFLSWKVLRQ